MAAVTPRQAVRDERVARARRLALASLERRLAETARQLERLAVRRDRVREQLGLAVAAGAQTEADAFSAELAWVDQRTAQLEAYLKTATSPGP